MVSFLQRVIVPDRPFQCTIDLALARRGSPADDRSDDLEAAAAAGTAGDLDEAPDAMMHDHNDYYHHHHHHANNGGFMDDGHMMAGGEMLSDGVRGGVHGHNGNHGYGRHGHPSAMGYDDSPRAEAYSSRGMGGPGYEHESEYGRPPPPPQMSGMSPWDQDGGGHGGEMMPKVRAARVYG